MVNRTYRNNGSLSAKLDTMILKILGKYGMKTRPELVKIVGSPRSTIYDSLARLKRFGLIDKEKEINRKKNRKAEGVFLHN